MPAGHRVKTSFPAPEPWHRHLLTRSLEYTCWRCGREVDSNRVNAAGGNWLMLVCDPCFAAARPAGEPYHHDTEAVGGLLRAHAEGSQPAPGTLADRPEAMIVGLRYLELVVAGELRAAALFGTSDVDGLHRVAQWAAAQRRAVRLRLGVLRQRQERQALRPREAPDHLAARVLRHVARAPFDERLRAALQRRGLPADALDVPVQRYWSWLATLDAGQRVGEQLLTVEVRHLRQLDDDAFRIAVAADAAGTAQRPGLSHAAVAERWNTAIGSVSAWLRRTLRDVEREVTETRPEARTAAQRRRLASAAVAHARAAAASTAATIAADELRIQFMRFGHQLPMEQLRADCGNEAFQALADDDPVLARMVTAACAAHRATCPHAKTPVRCRHCVDRIAATVGATGTVAPAQARTAPKASPSPPSSSLQEEPFACAATVDRLPAGRAHALVAAESRTASGGRVSGFAWVTADGELRTGTDAVAGELDGAVQVICRAALDLADGGTWVHVTCRDTAAVAVVQAVLDTGAPPAGVTLPERATAMLAQLPAHRRQVSVRADGCPEPHRGASAAADLAQLALRAGGGKGGGKQVQALADRIAQDLIRGAGPRLTAPAEDDDHAWLLGNSRRDALGHPVVVWQTAVRSVHLDGGWCSVPAGMPVPIQPGRRLRLRVEHQGDTARPPAHDVTLRRRRGGELELTGVVWPPDLRPGVLVTFKWRTDTDVVTAQTARLPQPERVDDVVYQHRYDVRVVTRDGAPGAGQELPVTGWVLRTLRTVGYLAIDGSATLAEDALIRDCARLGMPQRRLAGVGRAIDELLRDGRVRRVDGGTDAYGRPWLPARPGHLRTPLLQYLPRLETSASTQLPDPGLPAGPRRSHLVAGFVRRLQPGAQASAEQVELHRQAVRTFEVVERALPEGYTYVRRHRRGGPVPPDPRL